MIIDLKHITVAFDYASGDFVGMPMDVAKSQFAVEIIDKTDRYEPRATVKDINFSFNEDGQLQAEVVITNV